MTQAPTRRLLGRRLAKLLPRRLDLLLATLELIGELVIALLADRLQVKLDELAPGKYHTIFHNY